MDMHDKLVKEGRRPLFDLSTKQKIADDYETGIEVTELMKKYKGSRATIHRTLSQMKPPRYLSKARAKVETGRFQKPKMFDDEQVELIMLLWGKGFDIHRIALLHNCSDSTISHYVSNYLESNRKLPSKRD